MDPKACFVALCKAYYEADNEAFRGYQEDLVMWFRNGGCGFEVMHMPTGRRATVTHFGYLGCALKWRNNRRMPGLASWRDLDAG